MLADWATGSLEGEFDLRLEYRRTADPSGAFHISDVVTIVLHNEPMTANNIAASAIDVSQDVDLVIDGGDCHSYTKGSSFSGHLRVVDQYFGGWSLDLQPSTHTHNAAPSPRCRTYSSLADGGDGNLGWTLDTSLMDKCGYTLTLVGYLSYLEPTRQAPPAHWSLESTYTFRLTLERARKFAKANETRSDELAA